MRKVILLRQVILYFTFFVCHFSFSQSILEKMRVDETYSTKTVISSIKVFGNKRTRDFVVAREMTIRVGDTLEREKLPEAIKESESYLINSSLFNYVKIEPIYIDSLFTELKITVTERWYIWPIPIFQYADPNFNTWWQTKDFTRTNYGMNLKWQNFRGRKEELQARVQFGYLKDFRLNYYVPYLTKNRKLGGGIMIEYTQNNEFTVGTINNKRNFYTGNNENARDQFSTILYTTWRSKFVNSHFLAVGFNSNNITDSVTRLTNDYFVNNQTYSQYVSWWYTFRHTHLDNANYPMRGKYIQADISWNGFPVMVDNNLMVIAFKLSYKAFFKLSDNFYYAFNVKGKYTPTTDLPYYFQEGLGYKDYVRGYEYYIVDGQSYGLFKSNFKWKIFGSKVKEVKPLKNTGYAKLHFSGYLNLNFDAGYVVDSRYNDLNPLANNMLYGTGIGLDLVALYDKVIRFEYSFNKLLEHGFFIHFVKPI
jgi:outer membrane protein assembly factor BamA